MAKKVTASGAHNAGNVAVRGLLAPVPPAGDVYAELVRQASSGDPQAMERLLTRVQEVAWRFSMAVCGRADDAEDAMQEALIKTYRYTSSIREPEAFRPWLHRTVKNACLMNRRRRVHEPKRLESIDQPREGADAAAMDPPDPGRNPEQIADNTRLRARLQTALKALPASQRAIVFLREMQGLSTREVATTMGISEANVKTRLSRARKALQAALEEPAR
ncbi:MAG: RNA polymerase sigma factor [Vicinamibacterales bacterium]